MKPILVRGGTLVTMNAERKILTADLRLQNGKIVDIGTRLEPMPSEEVVEAEGCFVIPGLIQVHTHLVQCLFRGLADDLELLDWLKQKSGRWKALTIKTPFAPPRGSACSKCSSRAQPVF